MPTVAELQVVLEARDRLSGPLRSVGQDVARLERQVESTGGAFGRLGGFLGGLGLAGLGVGAITAGVRSAMGAVGGLVQQASDLNEQLSRSEVVFDGAAGRVQDFARTTAQSLGISRVQALEAAGSFGTLFRGVGLAEDAAADMSTGLVTLAADLASFNNLDPTEALDKLRSGLVGEAEPLRAVGVLLNEEAVKLKAVELGLGGANGQLTEAAKVQARYALILQQTQRAQGDFARTSTGLANAQRIIRASWADITTTLGQAFLPVASRVASFLATELPRALGAVQRATEAVGPALAALFSGDLQGAFERMLPLLQAMAGRIGVALGEWTRAFLEWAQALPAPLLERLGDLAGDVWAWIREQAPLFAERLVREWVPAFVRWVADVLPDLLVELGKMLGGLGLWVVNTALPELQALGTDMGKAMGRGMAEGLRDLPAVLSQAVREGISVDVGGIQVGAGTPVQIAAQVGQQVAAQVLQALIASGAVTDPGAAAPLAGAGR